MDVYKEILSEVVNANGYHGDQSNECYFQKAGIAAGFRNSRIVTMATEEIEVIFNFENR